jgi:hypothetical protein
VNPHRISLARTLPILALLLSYVIIAVPATMAYINVKSASRNGSDVIVRYHRFQRRIPHEHFLRLSVEAGADITSRIIQAVNLPGHFIEFAVAKCAGNSWRTWSPFRWDFLAWRAFSFPVSCLPFWWLTGVGLDGLLRRRELRWWHLVPSLILWAFFLMWVSVFYFGFSAFERTETVYPIWSVWLWFILLSAFPITWVKQWFKRRRIRTSLHARLSAELQ